MTNIITKGIFTGLILASAHLYAESYDFKPGLWETTSTIEIIEIDAPPEIQKMMRSMSNKTVNTETECIENLDSIFDSEPDDVEECKTTMKHISSNKMSVETLCTGPDGVSKVAGEINLNGETFTSSFEMVTNENSMKMKMKILGNGKYIGACE